jgi:hypothetical protein
MRSSRVSGREMSKAKSAVRVRGMAVIWDANSGRQAGWREAVGVRLVDAADQGSERQLRVEPSAKFRLTRFEPSCRRPPVLVSLDEF